MTRSLERDSAVHDVTSQSDIRGMLRRILKHHTLVSVKLPDSNGEFCSALLDVLANDGCWLLDELPVSATQDQVKPGHVLRIRGRLDGVEFRFKSRVEATGQSDGAGFYKMRIPETLRYDQRRSNYRAPVGAGQSIPITLSTSKGEELEGELRDVSDGGFRAVIKVSGETNLTRGDRLPNCQITISGEETIHCEAEVRYTRQQRPARSWTVGAQFLGLEPVQRRRIRELVAELQRRSVRLMARS